MEKFYREQPKNEDVRFVTIPEQKGEAAKWRGYEGGVAAVNELPVDSMEGLQVSAVIPEGYVAEDVKVEETVTEENL